MYCSKCGANVPENATFCSACGQPTGVTGAQNAGVSAGGYVPAVAMASVAVAAPTVKYAGFWLRFVAFIIDAIILGFIGVVVTLPFLGSLPIGAMMRGRPPGPDELAPLIGGMGHLFLLRIVVDWLYYALFESSAWQATIGKKALGLTVTDLEGRRIGFGRATGRFFAKILSFVILCIGFFMIAFTSKKQGLHDILAGTLVLRQM